MVLALAVHAALLGVAGQLRMHIPQPAASGPRPNPPPSASRLTFVRLDPRRAAAPGIERRERGRSVVRPASPDAPAHSGRRVGDESQPQPSAAAPPPGVTPAAADRAASQLLPNVDPRLYVLAPASEGERQFRANLAALRDSLRRTRSRQPAGNWTLSLGDGGTLGISSGIVLHFGHLTIPVPLKAIHLRDLGPDERARRSMIDEIREQGERARRDSVIAARPRP